MRHAALVGLAALLMLSCGHSDSPTRLATAIPVRVAVTAVPLNPRDPAERSIGAFVYAGGLELRAVDAGTIFELSDLRIVAGDRLVAVSDAGHLFEARLLFDESGRLSGLTDTRVIPLAGRSGERLAGAEADAEGLAILANGDRLVSFERHHRIWLYPVDGGPPRRSVQPAAVLPANAGMEAITRYPAAGQDAYLVGSEAGTLWLCRLSTTCNETAFGAHVPSELGLTALAAYGEAGGFAVLARAYDPERGVRVAVRLISTAGAPDGRVLDELTMAPELSVDNFEGLAVVPHATGDGLRLYLVSDDNGSATQRTYLLAFDWQPGP